ncbi:MAG: oxidoreductase [Chromatiaceae bacterium]|nr:oxidoreductase [Chromatiaceae bacterium]
MNTFPAYLITQDTAVASLSPCQLQPEDLMEGDVLVRVDYSTLNYKDALALSGRAPVVRRFPMIPGIDLAGEVLESTHPRWQAGDAILLNGFGVGEAHFGGYAARARLSGDWLIARPEGLSARQAMAIGTAGYTAMLCVMALEEHGLTPEAGEVLVTGASGGVGGIAVTLLARAGYRVVAVTGRTEEADYLRALGAAEVMERATFAREPRPLGRETWAGAIDVAGGRTLANVLSQMRYGGAVAACGLADSMELPTSVAPFILRGVTLYGVDSVMVPLARRETAWARLARELDLEQLARMTQDIAFANLPRAAEDLLAGRVRGRLVVAIPEMART